MAMDADFTTIEVHGVPSGFPEDQMIDKLMIHFLRPRNGGGEVLRVLYSSRTPHQAFVIFEHSDVAARVLQRAHVLQVEQQSFPLKLSQGERAEVDLPVRTTLDLWKFPNEEAVLSILSRYCFKVSRQNSRQLLLEGTFLKLSAARVKLAELLPSNSQSQSSFTKPHPSIHSTGAVSKRRGSSDTDMSYRQNGAAVHAGSKSLEVAEPSSASSLTLPHHPDDTQLDSYTVDSNTASFLSDSLQGRRHSASSRRGRTSFEVDTYVLHYARSFREDRVKEILQVHRVEMEGPDMENAEVSTVVLLGSDAPQAKEKLARFLTEVQMNLRTQEIPLSIMSQEQQSQVAKHAQLFSNHYKVLVLQVGDTLKLVGSSSESYEMKQRILGKEVSQVSEPSSRREGMAQERGRQPRRSSSLPRQHSRAGVKDSEPGAAVAAGYSSSKYGEGLVAKESRHRAGGTDSTPPTDPRRTRSTSESRVKVKEAKLTPGQGGIDRLHPAGAPMTTEKAHPLKKMFFLHNKPKLPNIFSLKKK